MADFAELKTKKDRIAHIKQMVQSNDKWAIRGLLRIFENQTADEQSSHSTRYENGIGFTGADAEILTSFAQQIKAGRKMSDKQMHIIRKKMPKYARQLESVAK